MQYEYEIVRYGLAGVAAEVVTRKQLPSALDHYYRLTREMFESVALLDRPCAHIGAAIVAVVALNVVE